MPTSLKSRLILLFVVLVGACSESPPAEQLVGLDRAMAATVRITAVGSIDGEDIAVSGSGVVLADGDRVITANHVVGGASQISVRVEGVGTFEAELVGASFCSDLALLQLPESMTSAMLGGTISLGDPVFAIGYPMGGRTQALTSGVVSRVGETVASGFSVIREAVQTDAAINPGNSGGPLVTSDGAVIGINLAGYDPGYLEGVGLAVPIAGVLSALPLLEGGNLEEWLGLELFQLPVGDEPISGGLYVSVVAPGSPSDVSGMRPGDVIVAVDGRSVSAPSDGGFCESWPRMSSDAPVVSLIRNGRWLTGTLGDDVLASLVTFPDSGARLNKGSYFSDFFAVPFQIATEGGWLVHSEWPKAVSLSHTTDSDEPMFVGYLGYEVQRSVQDVVASIAAISGVTSGPQEPVSVGRWDGVRLETSSLGQRELFDVLPGYPWYFEHNYRDVFFVLDVGGATITVDIQIPTGQFDEYLPMALELVESTQFWQSK